MTKKIVGFLIASSITLSGLAMETPQTQAIDVPFEVPSRLKLEITDLRYRGERNDGDILFLTHDEKTQEWELSHNDKSYIIKKHWVESCLSKISNLELLFMLGRIKIDVVDGSRKIRVATEEERMNSARGYIKIVEMSDGEIRIELANELKGGVWDTLWAWFFGDKIQEAVGTPGHISVGGVAVASMFTENLHDAAVLAAGSNVTESWTAHCSFSSSDTNPKEERKQRHNSQQKSYDFY